MIKDLRLQVTLLEARNLPVWGFPWQSNPYCRLILGAQAVRSRRDDDTSHAGSHRAPVWNQEFQFLVEDPLSQVSTFCTPLPGLLAHGRFGIVTCALVHWCQDCRWHTYDPRCNASMGDFCIDGVRESWTFGEK